MGHSKGKTGKSKHRPSFHQYNAPLWRVCGVHPSWVVAGMILIGAAIVAAVALATLPEEQRRLQASFQAAARLRVISIA